MGHHLITAVILTSFTLFNILPSEARGSGQGHGLHTGFYASSCPRVEEIVAEVVARVHERNPKLPPALIRLFFHDCFVKVSAAFQFLKEKVTICGGFIYNFSLTISMHDACKIRYYVVKLMFREKNYVNNAYN